MYANMNTPWQLKVLDFRKNLFTDEDAAQVIAEVDAGTNTQVQVRCDSQILANRIRDKVFAAAQKHGGVFEMTILGMGAAVGVKKHLRPQYVWDESRKEAIPIEQWNAEHPDNKVRT